MQSNVAICIILLSSIAFVILSWVFFARRRGEFKRALLVTHHISQPPQQLQARDLSSDTPPSSESTQSSSTTSGGAAVFDYRKARKARRVQPKQEMAGGLRRADEPLTAATRESTTTAVNAGTRTGGPSAKENRWSEGSGKSPPVDPVDGGWGGVSTTQEDQGGWGEESANPDASSAW